MSLLLKHEQQTKKIKQRLTFEEICPLWSAKYKTGNLEREHFLRLNDHRCCIVGEAYGFKCEDYPDTTSLKRPFVFYDCEKCETSSLVIYLEARANYYEACPKIQSEIDEFVNHWNDCHV